MKIEANGLTHNVAVEGEGDPVLLIHGFPDNHRLWSNQIAALNDAGYQTIAPDLRGFGDSDRPEGVDSYFILNALEDIRGILDHLDIERVHIVGHDFGSAVAWVFASVFPERTKTLTPISVGHPFALRMGGYEQYARSWYMFMFQFEGVAEKWLQRNDWEFLRTWNVPEIDQRLEYLARPGALTAALNWYRANITPSSWIEEQPELPSVQAPTMGVWSSGDVALAEDQMMGSSKFVSGPWRYERIDEVGHWVPLSAPDKLSELLVQFFSEQTA